jgi:uncharacterized RDD family membrane protein YckC
VAGETWRYLLTVEGRPTEISDGEATLGRGETATVRVEHDSVSRSHALLRLERGDVTIRDLDSANGTWIDGRRISEEVPLRDGSRFQVGAAVARLQILPPEGALSARFGPRVVATLVDAVILSAINAVLLTPVFLISYFQPVLPSTPLEKDRAFLVILALCGILVVSADLFYTAGLWALRGRTPGKSLLQLAIVRGGRKPGDGIGWKPAILRCLVMAAGAIPLFAGWWIAALRRDRRAWHDLAAGTRVIRMR